MKKLFTFFTLCSAVLSSNSQATFHDYTAISMSGDTLNMSQYYGKKVMIVNVAAHCGYTPQFAPLQQLYTDYQQYNFEIIGFPTDDFFQAGSDSEIVAVCEDYGITFPLTEQIHVSASSWGNAVHPVYQWLEKSSLNGVSNATVDWNFHKFLVDEAGHWVAHYYQTTQPNNAAIINWIMSPSVISSVPSVNTGDLFDVKSNVANSCIDCTLKNAEPQHYSIKIYSSQGQLVQTIFEGFSVAQNISYPVSSLAQGVYFINVQTKNAQKTFRYSVVK